MQTKWFLEEGGVWGTYASSSASADSDLYINVARFGLELLDLPGRGLVIRERRVHDRHRRAKEGIGRAPDPNARSPVCFFSLRRPVCRIVQVRSSSALGGSAFVSYSRCACLPSINSLAPAAHSLSWSAASGSKRPWRST